LLAMLAAWLGLRQTGLLFFLAVVVGALYGLGVILLYRRDAVDEENPVPAAQLPIPFGTMLSAAGIYCIFSGDRTLGWYLQFFH
jgi:prepilin signal peptidase PulO-like enzyme (type II secretory pathway)